MSDFGLIVKNGVVVGENTKVQGTTLSMYNLVSMTYASNVQVSDSDTIIDTYSSKVTRSAKYQVQIESGSEYQISEILMIQDGFVSKFTEYGVLTTGMLPLATFTTDLVGDDVVLRARMNSGTGSIWFSKTSINTVQAEIPLRSVTVTDRLGAIMTDRNGEQIEVRAA